MKILNYYFVFFFVLLSLVGLAQEKKYSFDHLTSNNGLPSNYIRGICKDYQGYIWFAGNDVCKYNGYEFTTYKLDGATLSSQGSRANAIIEDKKHNLWIATNQGVNWYDRKNDSFIFYSTYLDTQSNKECLIKNVNQISEDKNGDIWIGSLHGLRKYDRTKNKFISVAYDSRNPNETTTISALKCTSDGQLWIAKENGGFVVFNPSTKKTIFYDVNPQNPKSPLKSDPIDLLEDRKGRIWISSDIGVQMYDKISDSFIHYPIVKDGNSSTRVYSMVEDKDGFIWFATDGSGIVLYQPDKKIWKYLNNNLNEPNSISSNGVFTIYIDNENIVWVAAILAGIDIYNPNKNEFNTYKEQLVSRKGLSNKIVSGFYQTPSGEIYITTDKGGLNIFNPITEEFTHFKHDSKSKNSINSDIGIFVKGNTKGEIWVGTWGGGLNRFDPTTRKFTPYLLDKNNPSQLYAPEMDQGIVVDKNDNMWIAARKIGLIYYDSQKQTFTRKTTEAQKNEYGLSVIKKIFLDKEGNLWLGSDNKGLILYNIKNETFRLFAPDSKNPNAISSGKIRDIYQDSKGRFWIGTMGGLNLMDQKTEKFTPYGKNIGLVNDNINSILEDNKGNLWLATNEGLSKFNPDQLIVHNYSVVDGLQSNQFIQGAACKTRNGWLCFGGANGMNYFNPDEIKDNLYIPNVVITKLRIFNRIVSHLDKNSVLKNAIGETQEITFSHKESVITFEYAALNYTCTSKNKYAYILEGFEKEWNYVGDLKQATYTNLDAGTYTFRVKACNNDGIWNETGTSIKIIVLPPWWKTWWFYTLISAFVILSSVSFYLFRINGLNKQKKLLEKTVSERTLELQETNIMLEERQEEIMQQKEEIISQKLVLEKQNENVKSSIRYAKTIQEAMLPTEKALSESEHFIIYRPKDIVSGDFYWYIKIENPISHFIAAVDCTGHGVPGAFMSMIAYRILTEITLQRKIYEPHLLLEKVHKYLQRSLHQKETNNDEGMDICLCRVERRADESFKIVFAGSKRPLFYFEQTSNEIKILKGSSKHIGGLCTENLTFEQHEIILQKGDILYLSTDGYTDQNNDKRQSFGKMRLKNILNSISHLPMAEQKAILEKSLEEFQGDEKQRDDITLIGIKL